jgi:hypothetical protein
LRLAWEQGENTFDAKGHSLLLSGFVVGEKRLLFLVQGCEGDTVQQYHH